MKKKGNKRTRRLAAEAAFVAYARAIPPAARPGLLRRLLLNYARPGVRTRLRHGRRAFWEIDAETGKWRRL
jgi:hypothetical protein